MCECGAQRAILNGVYYLRGGEEPVSHIASEQARAAHSERGAISHTVKMINDGDCDEIFPARRLLCRWRREIARFHLNSDLRANNVC